MAILLSQSTNCCDNGHMLHDLKEMQACEEGVQEEHCTHIRGGSGNLRTPCPRMDRPDSIYGLASMPRELHDSLLCTGSPEFHALPRSASSFHRDSPMGPQTTYYSHPSICRRPSLPPSVSCPLSCLSSHYIGYRNNGAEAIVPQPKVFRLLCGKTPPPTYSLPFTLRRGRPGPVSDSL